MKKRNFIGMTFILALTSVNAAKFGSIKVLDKDYLQVEVLDGEVTFVDDGKGAEAFTNANNSANVKVVNYAPHLNLDEAQNNLRYIVVSEEDSNYVGGVAPVKVSRKSKLNGHAQKGWVGSDFEYESTVTHTLFLELPTSLKEGVSYYLDISDTLNIDKNAAPFLWDQRLSVSEAIHVNVVSYLNKVESKPADLFYWLGDGGPRDYSEFVGNKISLYNLDTKESQDVGTVSLHTLTSSNDLFWRDYTKSPVWNIDFDGDYPAGNYRLVVEGVGASQTFMINDAAFYYPYMVSVQGFFYMRIGQDSTEGVWPVPRRPLYNPGESPANTKVYITELHPFHPGWAALGSGDHWDKKEEWAAYVKEGSPTNPNAKGGHSDAADWDRHLGHISIVYDMLLPFVLTQGAIDDDNLDIAESGNGIPDILDEARYEIDFWLNLRDGAGYSHGVNNPDENNVMYQAGNTGLAAWASAANAAMLADCFRIAGDSVLMKEYRDSAVVAYQYAGALAEPMLDSIVEAGGASLRGVDLKMTAAAYLYNVTGDTLYENDLAAASIVNSETSKMMVEDKYAQIWAVAGYLMTPQVVHHTDLYNQMKASVIYQATQTEQKSKDSRASRRITPNGKSLGYWMTSHNVHHSLVAHAISDDAGLKADLADGLILEASYGLGRNSMNMIQMTTASTPIEHERSVQGAYTTGRDDGAPGLHPGHTPYFNLDDWYCDMQMGCPSKLLSKDYPEDFAENWPWDEAYHNTRFVWAHNEFTPQQTMRGKMALYGYLYGMGEKVDLVPTQKPILKDPFKKGEYSFEVYSSMGKLLSQGNVELNALSDFKLNSNQGIQGVYFVKLKREGQVHLIKGFEK